MTERSSSSRMPGVALWIFAIVTALVGAAMAYGGVQLVTHGGSPYFLIAGIALVVVAVLYLLRDAKGAWLYALVYLGTLGWAVFEVGLKFWSLIPRITVPTVLAVFAALLAPQLDRRGAPPARTLSKAAAWAMTFLFIGLMALTFKRHEVITGSAPAAVSAPVDAAAGPASEWREYGHDPAGSRFAPFSQINKDNVKQLQVAWTYRTGDIATGGADAEDTPIQVGDTLFSCTPNNIAYALDADTGKQKWRFDPKTIANRWKHCRGVGYFDDTAAGAGKPCARRIVLPTINTKLIELDADTGKLCEEFGNAGILDLSQNMGEGTAAVYYPTSAPTVVANLILIGGYVRDNRTVDAPSGVFRAFDARTGRLVWAWNAGETLTGESVASDKVFRRGSPNVWSTPAFDEALGLVYLPVGNPSPDFWGGLRTPADETYGSTIVALEYRTGVERWRFQTVHHDVWDYDVSSQPALVDLPVEGGVSAPAILVPTKRGQTFVLDRRTGEPLTSVEERATPQGAAPGDRLSPTQPYSVGFPAVGAEALTEADMWGATPFDLMYCRIWFRKMKYEGEFTPQGLKEVLAFPGHFGGFNWGSGAVDRANGLFIINGMRLGRTVRLIPRAEADAMSEEERRLLPVSPQLGTPFAVGIRDFLSPAGIPCLAPPWGSLTGIDLATRKILWQVPLGTTQDTGPWEIPTHLQIPLGMPTIGGPMVTAGGLVFHAGTSDFYLRAYDSSTGAQLWRARLPVGAGATPMSYVSPKTGRQYVVISAGGSRNSRLRGDYLIAYALPGTN